MAVKKNDVINMINNDLVDSTTNTITGESLAFVLENMVELIGEGSGNKDPFEYWSLENITGDATEVIIYAVSAKIVDENSVVSIGPGIIGLLGGGTPIAMCISPDVRFIMEGMDMTFGELLEGMGGLESLGAKEITKEAYYSLDI